MHVDWPDRKQLKQLGLLFFFVVVVVVFFKVSNTLHVLFSKVRVLHASLFSEAGFDDFNLFFWNISSKQSEASVIHVDTWHQLSLGKSRLQ